MTDSNADRDLLLQVLEGLRGHFSEEQFPIAQGVFQRFHEHLQPAMDAIDKAFLAQDDAVQMLIPDSKHAASAMKALVVGGILGFIEGREPEIFESYIKGRQHLDSEE